MTGARSAPCGTPLPHGTPPVVAAATVPLAAVPVECALCGLVFVPEGTTCGGCPLHAGCDLARCPRCAYTFPRTSRLWELLQRLAAQLRRALRARGPASEERR